MAIVERLERFFRDILKHPQARESAARVESSIYQATSTKDEYKRMIMNKMQHLQQQQNLQQQQTTNNQKTFTLQERQDMRSILQGIQPKVPMIDKIIADNTRNQRLEPEMVRKFASLRNILVKQLGLLSSDPTLDTFIMSPSNLAALVDQLLKMMAMFAATAKVPEQQSALQSKLREYQRFSVIDSVECDEIEPSVINITYITKELEYLLNRFPGLTFFVNQIRSDVIRVKMTYNHITIDFDIDCQYPGVIKKYTVSPQVAIKHMPLPMSLTSFFRSVCVSIETNQ